MNSIFIRIYLVTIVFFALALLLFSKTLEHIDSQSEDLFTKEAKEWSDLVLPKLLAVDHSNWQKVIDDFNEHQIYIELTLQPIAELQDKVKVSDLKTKGNLPMDTEDEIQQVFWLNRDDLGLVISSSGYEESPLSTIDEYGTYILLLLALSVGYASLIYLITKPIKKLTKAVNLFSIGDTDVRVDENHPKPINQLAKKFNQMADKISQQLEQQRIMIGAIPHELRTPLSHIRFALDMTNTSSEMAYIRGLIEQIDSSTDEMEQAINDTVDFLKIQDMNSLPTQICHVHSIVNRAFNNIDTGEIEVNNLINKNLNLKLNESLMVLALKNIFSNAIRHTLTQVEIQALTTDQQIKIVVNDDGPGIPEKSRKEIFAPFGKACDSRQKTNTGIGMGLSMVAMIIQKHNGEIKADENDWGGASIIITLPQTKKV